MHSDWCCLALQCRDNERKKIFNWNSPYSKQKKICEFISASTSIGLMNAYTYIQSPSTLIYTVFGAHNKHNVYKSYFISSETVFIFISLFVCLQQVFFHLLFSFLNFIAITLCFRGIDYVFNCTKVLATEKQRKKDSYFCILQRSFFQHFLFHWRCRQHVEYAWICINRVFFCYFSTCRLSTIYIFSLLSLYENIKSDSRLCRAAYRAANDVYV